MKYFDDFLVGERIVTRGRTITETDIVLFAAFSGDWYPLHTNIEYAKKSLFGERIAHGLLILSVASGLIPLEEMAIIAFYGMEKVRFLESTKIGNTIHVETEVTGKEEKNEKSGVILFNSTVKNQKDKDLVSFNMKLLMERKEIATTSKTGLI